MDRPGLCLRSLIVAGNLIISVEQAFSTCGIFEVKGADEVDSRGVEGDENCVA